MSTARGTGTWLFQCVALGTQRDGVPVHNVLVFTRGGKPHFTLQEIPHHTPLVALYDVHVRVDPTSLAQSQSIAESRFFVVGDDPVLCTSGDFTDLFCVNVATGEALPHGVPEDRLSFDRWSLVLDDDTGDELTIAAFGYEDVS